MEAARGMALPRSARNEVNHGRGQDDVNYCSVIVDDNVDEGILGQKLHGVMKQREELQQIEIELRSQFLVRSEIMDMQTTFDAQIKEHATTKAKLQEQLREREHKIAELEKRMEEKEREMHVLRLDTKAAWAKEDLLREQSIELQTYRRERDSSEAERAQHIKQIHDLQEHMQEKERQFLELQEQMSALTKNSLRSALEKCKLNGTNFNDWSRTLRIVLKHERLDYVLSTELPPRPDEPIDELEQVAYQTHEDDALEVQCLMLANMEPNLQIQFENVPAFEMYGKLEDLFQKHARNERYDVVCALMDCKLPYGQPTSPHVLKMIGLVERLKSLGTEIPNDLAVDIILRSLPDQFNNFVMNFNMHQLDMSLSELHGMINNAETNVKKGKAPTSSVLTVQNKKAFKKKKKGTTKDKVGSLTPAPIPAAPAQKKGPTGDDKCHYCNTLGHWKRNCKKYLEDKKNGTLRAGTSGK